ncbi:cell division protein FtsX [Aminiphilus circumscriptus]|jgi:cell division transport system permease protein|uniref:cell division protein FtsX n=1 Tax=Aminiphilus circumscriptus TaxID=290732 RepID=UPI0004928044|nr:permease-like cell division protein FtsX [Aminiphilus circumscriptus]
MGTFRYILRDTNRLLFRHWGLSLLTLFTAVAVFFLVGSSALFMLNTRYLVARVESELLVQAYVKSEAQLQTVADKAHKIPGVASVRWVTTAEAMERLKARLKGHAQALTILGENPLPPSLEIGLVRAVAAPSVARELLAMPEVDDVIYAGGLADKLARVSRFATRFSMFVLVIAVTASALVLFNTIRISIYSRRDEIGVMLLVGATPTFVALPFVLQGMLLGMGGALGASLLIGGGYEALVQGVEATLPFVQLFRDSSMLLRLGLILLGGGITVGWISSWMAVERFIRRALRPM